MVATGRNTQQTVTSVLKIQRFSGDGDLSAREIERSERERVPRYSTVPSKVNSLRRVEWLGRAEQMQM